MPDLVFAIPGDPGQRTGGYIYDRRLGQELAERGWNIRPLRLPDGFPSPSAEALAASDRLLSELPDGLTVLVDGLAFGSMPDVVERHTGRLTFIALVHHPLGYETGPDPERAEFLIRQERRALRHARRVLVTSPTTQRTLENEFGVPAEKLTAALPGTDPAPVAQGSHRVAPALLAVGSILPRKDFTALILALAPWRSLAWTLTIAGSAERDPGETERVKAQIVRHGMSDRVRLVGEIDGDALSDLLDRTDLFVSSSRYEGFGMALAEAVARGLPVVAVAGGAIADWMDPRAALLVPPDQPAGLNQALGRVLADPAMRSQLRHAALAARERLPSWADCARRADALIRSAIAA